MSEHLKQERISALLDEPWADMEAEAHLEACEACRVEYERLSRMRMALSGLGDLEPPAGEWAAIQQRLGASPYVPGAASTKRRRGAWGLPGSLPLQAAAAFALFAGGLLAGSQLAERGAPGQPLDDPGRLPAAVGPGFGPGAEVEPEDAYYSALAELDALRSPVRLAELEREDGSLDPVATAQLLARLNALILASRAAIDESPGDPVANGLLFQLVEERQAVTERLRQSARLTSTESW